jgi:hypothetical protein
MGPAALGAWRGWRVDLLLDERHTFNMQLCGEDGGEECTPHEDDRQQKVPPVKYNVLILRMFSESQLDADAATAALAESSVVVAIVLNLTCSVDRTSCRTLKGSSGGWNGQLEEILLRLFFVGLTVMLPSATRGGIHQIFPQFFYNFSTIFLRFFSARISRLFRAKS